MLTGADALVLLDDDEDVRNPDLLEALTAPLADGWHGNAGLYMEGGRRVVVPVAGTPATQHFDANGPRLQAFAELLESGRPVDAPFAFGGNLALARQLFAVLPFDPIVTRGEDVDYVISARLRGYRLQLDPSIRVDHYAPPRTTSPWQQLWNDGLRFLAQRRKLACAYDAGCAPLDLDPYPGQVLTDDLGERLARAVAALGGPAAEIARLGAWERELEDRDPWNEYRATARRWTDVVEELDRADPRDRLFRVEAR